jgi:hypothetical protein
MRTLIVYESMYGNTRAIAEHIAEGMALAVARVVPVHEATVAMVHEADLLVVGAPTHGHSMPRPSTRKGAVDQAGGEDGLSLEPHATDDGVRELLSSLDPAPGRLAAAFDTRVDIPPLLSGRASKSIAHQLRRHRFDLLAEPESFLVDKHTRLLDGELDRARLWGHDLDKALVQSLSQAVQ